MERMDHTSQEWGQPGQAGKEEETDSLEPPEKNVAQLTP
jgi:hypothetical protein